MIQKELYKGFCSEEVDIPIFSRDWWLDSVCGPSNWEVLLVKKNNNIIASFPYYIKKKKNFKISSMPILTQNLGPYIKYPLNQKYEKKLSLEKEIYFSLIDQLPDFAMFNQSFHYSITNWLPFYWKGYSQTTKYTYIINGLSNLDSVFNNINPKYRNKIRKAQKIVTVSEEHDIERFYNINKRTFSRQNIEVPYSLNFLKRHDKALSDHKARRIFMAVDSVGKIHSELYLTWDNQSSYVHMVGEDPELRKSGAGILLVWEAIKYTSEKLGLNKFDFEGSMLENIEQVRRSFGAVQKPYFQISKNNSRIFKIAAALKNIKND